HVYGPLKPI
nr:Chain C, HIS-VAL-TYR-GLY-PRO-LEU-LYS-PRO-ILE [synthetic construct]